MTTISTLPDLMRRARIQAGMTQQDLAGRMGTSQSAIANLEAGRSNPTIETAKRWAGALGLSLELMISPAAVTDPVIELYKKDVDRTLLRENLRRPVDERLATLAEWQENVAELQRGTIRAKRALRVAEKSR